MKMNVDFKIALPARLPDDPLADAGFGCLRLLLGFLLRHGRPGPDGRHPLAGALGRGEPACRALPRLVALAHGAPAIRHELDRRLDRELRDAAAPFEPLSPFELAALWAERRHELRGRPLAALLWVVARRNDLPGRTLAARIARGVEPRQLVLDDEPPAPRRKSARV
jgi:hypothetical protein